MSPSPDPAAHRCPIEVCDVVDTPRLRRFREKMSEWRTQLAGEDPHSIWQQIHAMLWDSALFRTVNDLRRDAQERPQEGIGFNGTVLRLFDNGFVTTQVAAIRRLTERQAKDPAKRVISLRALLDDVQANRSLLTRENYVAFDGTPYDTDAAMRRWMDRIGGGGSGASPTIGPEAWGPSHVAHLAFDTIAERPDPPRDRGDLVSPACFAHLVGILDQCRDVRKFTDKFIAHGADPSNRGELTDAQRGVSLEKLATCQRAIYQVAGFVSGTLLGYSSVMPVPIPQYDHLAGLDKAWIGRDTCGAALGFWREQVALIEAWQSERIWPLGE